MKEVRNLTTGAVVRARGITKAAVIVMVIAAILWIAWMAYVISA
ncbi:hypothetical protein [Microbispora sp. GKU 823]|nr:hypothetical protein [Microbispora sp. GKU 823]